MDLKGILSTVRRILAKFVSKDALLFLFFLALSTIFWFVITLNEVVEKEIKVPVCIVDVPKNVVLTSDEFDTLKVVVRDKGLVVAAYYYGGVKTVNIRFQTYAKGDGKGNVSASELKRLLSSELSASTSVTSVKPDRYTFYYNYGLSRKIPVKWVGMVIPESTYFLARTQISPDSVTVFASKEKLDSITHIRTAPLNQVGFRDTLHITTRLEKMEGVKCVPSKVDITFFTDVLTEERMDNIPIIGTNLPEGKILRTFPGRVAVKFVGGVNLVRTLRPEDFIVTVDYREIADRPSDKCSLTLKSVPAGISRVKLETEQVDYLIEDAR